MVMILLFAVVGLSLAPVSEGFATVEACLSGSGSAVRESVPAPDPPKASAVLAREAREAYDRGDRETWATWP